MSILKQVINNLQHIQLEMLKFKNQDFYWDFQNDQDN